MTTLTIRPATLTDIPQRWLTQASDRTHGSCIKALRDLYVEEWRKRGYWSFP